MPSNVFRLKDLEKLQFCYPQVKKLEQNWPVFPTIFVMKTSTRYSVIEKTTGIKKCWTPPQLRIQIVRERDVRVESTQKKADFGLVTAEGAGGQKNWNNESNWTWKKKRHAPSTVSHTKSLFFFEKIIIHFAEKGPSLILHLFASPMGYCCAYYF